jgi:DNA repair protein RadC
MVKRRDGRSPRAAEAAPEPGGRPRERFYATGGDDVSDAELIALVLGTGIRGKSAVAIATEILDGTGGVAALGRAPPQELAAHAGIGAARAARLGAAFALGRRALVRDRPRGAVIVHGLDVYEHVWPRLAGLEQEVFMMLALDARSVLLADIEVARGSLTGVEVHPREVFRPLIRVGATAAIAVHNHPSGDPTPSREDVVLTERLHAVGTMIGIPIVDHVVVAARGWASVAAWLEAARLPSARGSQETGQGGIGKEGLGPCPTAPLS